MLKIENLTKTYDKNTRRANEVLHGVSLSLESHGFVCILGQSGCGKTSLLNAIGGLDTFDGGDIVYNEKNLRRRRDMDRLRASAFGYIFQNYYLLQEHSVAYNVYLGMHSLPLSKKEKARRVKDALEQVDMFRYRKRPVCELSGGQQQRVAIARAVACRPKVIFADEPTGNLDEANTLNICSILKELSHDSLVIMVTHEERIARLFADRIITLDDGNITSDTTDWSRPTLNASAKDTLYCGDFNDKKIEGENLSIRVLTSEDSEPIELTIIADGDRIVIKHSDPRIILCSNMSQAPYIAEGSCPVLSYDELRSESKEASHSDRAPSDKRGEREKPLGKAGLGAFLIWCEARNLSSGKRLRSFGTGVFVILLTLMLALTVADYLTVSSIDPEDFITNDSHTISIDIKYSKENTDDTVFLGEYRNSFRDYLNTLDIDFDYIPASSIVFQYTDPTFPQMGEVSMKFNVNNWVELTRFDSSTLILGRMPERYDEVIVDRFALEKSLEGDGIVENMIPSYEYFLGKTLTASNANKTTKLKIVGICDSGDPVTFMSRGAMLALASYGTEVITQSEYERLTGDTSLNLGGNMCAVITKNAPGINNWNGPDSCVGSGMHFTLAGYIYNIDDYDPSIGAKLVISDDIFDKLYDSMIACQVNIKLYSPEKQRLISAIETGTPEELKKMVDITITDKYAADYAEYAGKTAIKVDARMIIIFTVTVSAVILLYFMQRSKIRGRMDLVTVYRLLGIKKRSLLMIFAIENMLLTLKYALPTVLAIYLSMLVIPRIEPLEQLAMLFPISAALLTIVFTMCLHIITATLPLLRLLAQPPARLASKYDF